MYLEYYGLKAPPFSITPDPRYVFLSERHRDALAHLLYGIGKGGGGGFVQLTGEVGTGKTTLCRLLLEQLPENTRAALVLNPNLSPVELLETICEELKLSIDEQCGSLKGLVDTLNAYLLDAYAQGLRVVLIADEAQNLSIDALEQIRLLTNLETPTQKLLQIILLGQPELRDVLARPELRQLAQRITARYHLTPLNSEETGAYVRHRMAVAGNVRFPFSRLALRALYQRSNGIPRLINVIAERALMAGFAREQDIIGERLIHRAADETLPGHARYRIRRYGRWVIGAVFPLIIMSSIYYYRFERKSELPMAVEPNVTMESSSTEDSLSQKLIDRIRLTSDSELIAWTQLLARWQVTSNELSVKEATGCAPSIVAGLSCLHGHGTLEQLARFDRPLILLLSHEGKSAYALLLAVGKRHVQLDFGGERFELDRGTLAQLWPGEFMAIWKVPSGVAAVIRKGDAGDNVAWVKAQVAKMDSAQSETGGPAFFDATLEERVKKLQLAYGIAADGIVGPETFFALSSLEGSGPHLARNVD